MNEAPSTDVLDRREEIEAPPDPSLYTTLKRLATAPDHRLVIGFGGGSVPGIAGNLALASLLEDLDLKPHVDSVWGTSAGSIVGAGFASGTTAREILELVKSLAKGNSIDVCWRQIVTSVVMRPLGRSLPDGLVHGRHFEGTIARGLPYERIEDCPIDFRCLACSDDGDFRTKVFRRGPLLDAIMASMSIPGVIVPRPPGEDGSSYYDGGLVEKTPLISPIAEHQRLGDDRKLLLLTTHFRGDATPGVVRGFLGRLLHSIYGLEELAWRYQVAEARAYDNVVLMLLDPGLKDPSLFDFDRAERNYLEARAAFKDRLQNAKLGLTFGQM